MKVAIGAAIIEDGKILLLKKGKGWILPGGKPEPGESEIECICREVDEELSGTQLENFEYYGDFEGITPNKGYHLRARVYFANIIGELGEPSAEIEESAWVEDSSKYVLSDITSKIVDSLIIDKYL